MSASDVHFAQAKCIRHLCRDKDAELHYNEGKPEGMTCFA